MTYCLMVEARILQKSSQADLHEKPNRPGLVPYRAS
jgi:hypothetical protein